MEKARNSFLFFAFSLLLAFFVEGSTVVNGSDPRDKNSNNYNGGRRLFVFGDSYADTGNLGKIPYFVHSWYEPYGMTFPRKPAGRFSDGRVLTDYVASLMKARSPIPYKYRKFGQKLFPYGMNFAVGGSGIFDTGNFQFNLTAQIDHFQSELDAGVFSNDDFKSAVALVVISGNDYFYLKSMDPDHYLQHIGEYMNRLFIQFKKDLLRLQNLGFSKVVVNNMHPIGFTPYMTRATNYTRARLDVMRAVYAHNRNITEMVKDLNRPSSKQIFFPLDIFGAFMKVIKQVDGVKQIKYPMVPCCKSTSEDSTCGQVDDNGIKKYTVCSHPEQHFYWDTLHPTQAGWSAAFNFLKTPLGKFLSSNF